MTEKEVRELLELRGALLDGHFVFNSKKHGDIYVNKDTIYMYPCDVVKLCRALAGIAIKTGNYPDVVIAPSIGAIILGQTVALHLNGPSGGTQVLSTYAEKDGDDFIIKRGYEKVIPGKKVLVVEDLFTTGGSARKVVDAVRRLDGNVIGVIGLVNRGGVAAEAVGSPPLFASLISVTMDSYDPEVCPLCRKDVKIDTHVGHGAQFLKEHPTAV